MNSPQQEAVEQESAVHVLSCAAPPSVLYDLVADVSRWPAILEPVIYVQHHGWSGQTEQYRLWALVGDRVCSWASRRELDPAGGFINFAREHDELPITEMAGIWKFQALEGGSRVELGHWFNFDGSDAERDKIIAAIDDNSTHDLAAMCRLATLGHPVSELVFSFADEVELPVSVADAYSFVYRADLWPEVLPHVGRVVLGEPQPDVQDMEMDSVGADGRVHTTRSLRLCFPGERIVYKQILPPTLLLGHCGEWEFAEHEGGTLVTSRHSVAINPTAVAEVLGPSHDLADARNYLRDVLSASSRTTLEHACDIPARAMAAGLEG
ncbi:MAG: aromatase/cyclase [Streptosporangiaceae bacterium]|nr:aromatase/cyclase [Streptosporangiaceae bacterium]